VPEPLQICVVLPFWHYPLHRSARVLALALQIWVVPERARVVPGEQQASVSRRLTDAAACVLSDRAFWHYPRLFWHYPDLQG
jgi:hypothetical protein